MCGIRETEQEREKRSLLWANIRAYNKYTCVSLISTLILTLIIVGLKIDINGPKNGHRTKMFFFSNFFNIILGPIMSD